jgi:hypothetical protein
MASVALVNCAYLGVARMVIVEHIAIAAVVRSATIMYASTAHKLPNAPVDLYAPVSDVSYPKAANAHLVSRLWKEEDFIV